MIIGFGANLQMPQMGGGGGFNPLAMLMQGMQMMGALSGGNSPFGQMGGGPFAQMGGSNPFGACGNPAANLGGNFGQQNSYQAGFQAGMQAASGGNNPYQAGFQQGLQAGGGGFPNQCGMPGSPCGGGGGMPGMGQNPLMEILNMLMRLLGGGGNQGGCNNGGFNQGNQGFPGMGNNGGGPGPFGGNHQNYQSPGSHHGPDNYHAGPVNQSSLNDGGVRQAYDQGQMNNGKLKFTAGMQIDCDGSGSSHGDPCFQGQTSMRLANGRSLNADNTPFIVLPPQMAKKYGVKLGDLCMVRKGDKVSPAIFGDVGPRNKLGEGSVRLAQNLGINSSPTRGGTSGGVEYTVFPGSGKGVKWTQENTTTEALWERIRAQQGGG